MLADTASEALKKGDLSAESFTDYGKSMQSAIETMRKIVYAFYDENFSFKELIQKDMHLRSDLTDCLVGNIEGKDFTSLFEALSELADMPEPIEFGLPKFSK